MRFKLTLSEEDKEFLNFLKKQNIILSRYIVEQLRKDEAYQRWKKEKK